MHVLLLRPVPGNDRFGLGPFFRIEPLGLEYVAAALEAQGHRTTVADLRYSRSLDSLLRTAPRLLVEASPPRPATHARDRRGPGAGGGRPESQSRFVRPRRRPFSGGIPGTVLHDECRRRLPVRRRAGCSGAGQCAGEGAQPVGCARTAGARRRRQLHPHSGSRAHLRARRGSGAAAARRRPMAAAVRVSPVQARVADRNGAGVPLPVLVLFRVVASRPCGAPSIDRKCLRRFRGDRPARVRRRRSVLVSTGPQSGTGPRVEAARGPEAMAPGSESDRRGGGSPGSARGVAPDRAGLRYLLWPGGGQQPGSQAIS